MWGNFGNPTHGWTAATYLVTFLLHMFISVVELVGWSAWAIEYPGADCFYKYYVSNVGYWLELYGGILTWVFPFLQIVLPSPSGLNGNYNVEFGFNSIYLTVGNGLMWIAISGLHIAFVP